MPSFTCSRNRASSTTSTRGDPLDSANGGYSLAFNVRPNHSQPTYLFSVYIITFSSKTDKMLPGSRIPRSIVRTTS